MHDWDGLTEYEMKRADMLAELGYNVFAVDLFGQGVRPTENEHKKLLTGDLYKDRERMRNLFKAAYAEAQNSAGEGAGTVAFGYCFGGAVVLEMARSGMDLEGFVTFHGGLATPEGQDYSTAKGKIMVFHGTADSAISMEDFGNLAAEFSVDLNGDFDCIFLGQLWIELRPGFVSERLRVSQRLPELFGDVGRKR